MTEEERLKWLNDQIAPEGKLSNSGDLNIKWPQVTGYRGVALVRPVTMNVPAEYKPEPVPNATKDKKFVDRVYIKITLSGIEPWKTSPPIHPDIYDGPRLYSALNPLFGRKTDSMDNPETRAKFDQYRELKRKEKRVWINRNSSFDSPSSRRWDGPWSGHSASNSIADGKVSGLLRFSSMRCFENIPALDAKRKEQVLWKLANKASDDPSSKNCYVDRNDVVFVSPPDSNPDEWTYMECSPVLLECSVKFQAAKRVAEVRIWTVDVPIWREIIEPLRKTINGFVVQ